ncbi:hypothetical protein AAZV13_04G204300 [Glycine max]
MVVGRITIYLPLGFTLFLFASVPSQISANESYVLTLDHSNFSDTISISSSLSSTHHGMFPFSFVSTLLLFFFFSRLMFTLSMFKQT